MAQEDVFRKLVAHCKEYGYVFPSSEIYDGLGAVYDYGQYGVELKNNIKKYWWDSMVLLNENIVGLDSAIFMHPTIWKASGHVDAFNDPLIDNRDSKKRYRADVLIEEHLPAVLGTETYLYQIFSNLLGNALKYRDHTRHLRISIASSSAASVRRRRATWSSTARSSTGSCGGRAPARCRASRRPPTRARTGRSIRRAPARSIRPPPGSARPVLAPRGRARDPTRRAAAARRMSAAATCASRSTASTS